MGSEQSVPWLLIISTLVVRFIAVFVVLSVLGVGMSIAGKILSKLPSGE